MHIEVQPIIQHEKLYILNRDSKRCCLSVIQEYTSVFMYI